MPELPEVQTTVNGINKKVKGKKITDIWTSYDSSHYKGKDDIKDPEFFKVFKKKIVGSKILNAKRRAKNILINLSNSHTILIHMKMTGHLLFGEYKNVKGKWVPRERGPLSDPFNSHIRLVFTLDDKNHLVLSDMRKFAKVTLIPTSLLHKSIHLENLGPEPLENNFKFEDFELQIKKRPKGKIKQVLMDQTLIAGIGNIYSDEILWRAGVHPLSEVQKIPKKNFMAMFKAMKETLRAGIELGGDSMSDYRNIEGKKGEFQEHHSAYRKTGENCSKKGCRGIIERMVVAGRSAHFCNVHQKIFN